MLNVADLMTKSLSKRLFMQHRKSIVISSLGRKSALSETRGVLGKFSHQMKKLHTCQNFSIGVSANPLQFALEHTCTINAI